MAKEKKRGFFSWLGFGQKEQAQETETEQKVEEQQAVADESPVAETPAEPSAPKADPEAFAEDVVEVTETVVESEKAHLAEPASVQEKEWVETPALVEDAPVVEPEPAVSEPPEQPAVVEPLAEEVIAEPVVAEAVAEQPVADVIAEPQETEVPEEDAPLSDEELEALALAAEAAEEAAVVVPEPEDEAPVEALAQEQEKPTKEGFFARLKRSLLKTKENLGSGFISLFRGKKIDDDLFEELEEQLLIADVGVETTRKIITNLTEGASRKQLRDAEALYGLLKEEMGEILAKVDEPLNVEGKTPFVILMVGVNGVGKTTTIGKLARQFEQQGKSVMLAAGDTSEKALYHELYHVMETHILGNSIALDQWAKLNPVGFEYDYDYLANAQRDGSEFLQPDTRSFVDTYSMSYPKEDRARIFEYAMTAGNEPLFAASPLQYKLKMLCQGIREAFGLKKSPENFLWEQYLNQPMAYTGK